MRLAEPMLRRAYLSVLALMLAAALGVAACSAAGRPAGGAVKTAAAHRASTPAGSGSTAARPRLPRVTIAAVGDTMLGNTPDLHPTRPPSTSANPDETVTSNKR